MGSGLKTGQPSQEAWLRHVWDSVLVQKLFPMVVIRRESSFAVLFAQEVRLPNESTGDDG